MTGYRYPTKSKRRPGVSKLPKPANINFDEPEEQLTLIQGQAPGSKEEWRVAMALYQLGYEFTYQKPLFGGYMSGGQIVDFWIYKGVLPTPLLVHGEAWHTAQSSTQDDFRLNKLKSVYRGYIQQPIIIWASKIKDIDTAKQLLKELL